MSEQALVEKNQQQVQVSQESSAVLSMIERVATDPQADITKLEKMLDMQERILDRNARMEFDAALASMQSELPEVEKLATGHNSKYAKFEHILAAIKPSLLKWGFSITHRVKSEGDMVHITGILSHKSGHREETTLTLPHDKSGNKNAVQAVASSTEYGRRYTMNSLIGIATKDADQDGGAPPAESKTLDEKQIGQIIEALAKSTVTEEQFLADARVEKIHLITQDRFDAALNHLKKRAAQ